MGAPYARSNDIENTTYMTFRVIHSDRGGSDDAAGTVDADSGKSPVARWLTWALDHDDFVSNPTGATGHMAKCQVPRGTIALKLLARLDEVFDDEAEADDIDIGDGNDTDGWADSLNWITDGVGLYYDADAAYNTGDASAGVSGPQYYSGADTIDVLWKNATAPTQGKVVIFLQVISYHENVGAEW